MRIIRQPWGLALLLAASLIASSGVARAETRPVVRLDSEVKDGVVRLVAQSTAPFQYTTSRPNRSLFVLDLSGVSAPQASSAKILDSDLVSGYRVLVLCDGRKVCGAHRSAHERRGGTGGGAPGTERVDRGGGEWARRSEEGRCAEAFRGF